MRRVLAAFLVAVFIGGMPHATAAAAGKEPYFTASGFKLQASNGYTVYAQYAQNQVVLVVVRRGRYVQYLGEATITENGHRVDATLGSVAEIHLTFHREEIRRYRFDRCPGEVTYARSEFGTYTGSVVFRGGKNFSRVEATRARSIPYAITCSTNSTTSPGSGAELTLERSASGVHTDFTARKNHKGTPVNFFASMSEERDGLEIVRSVSARAETSSFTYDRPLTKAVIRPPAPFTGTGVLRRLRGGARNWRGVLRASFPGRPGVVLTGARQRVRYLSGDFFQQ